ncbi:unnamed protein product [Urochloa decumbens]|uniref:DUF4220 domain-containing protein n=1 Tax=Urochloa decumbens TaxID=240449 RepID=A0ABC9B782_9POAL
MAGAEVAMQAWKEWGLQALVLLSLTVQVALLILGELRRHIDSGVLMAFVWSAYMLADAAAIYVLGHLSVTSRTPEQELLALWAPFLLLHLGGQDNITAYALEDNKLWLRHLQTFVAQVAAASYIIYGSSIIIGERWSMLLLVTILVFFVGLVKYGERVWALRCAGSSPTGNYRGRRGGGEVSDGHISECPWVPEPLKRRRLDSSEAFLLKAHLLLDFAKDVFKGPLSRIALYGTAGTTPAGSGLDGEEVYKMVEMQVSLVHDLFYTKAEVTHTWYGLCIRMLSWLAIGVAFLLFNILLLCDDHHRKLKGGYSYSRVDVVVTYVLFAGAVVLETASLVRAMFSSWTCALLLKRSSHSSGSKRIAAASACTCTFVVGVVLYLRRLARAADLRRRCSWSRCMGQHNLVQFCVRSRASRIRRVAKWVGVENWWDMQAYSWAVPVSACIKQQLLKRIRAMPEAREEEEEEMQESQEEEEEEEEEESSASSSSEREVPEARQWGREALMNRGLYENLARCIKFNKLDESILVWHIATDVYLCWYKDQQEQAKPPDGGGGDDRRCQLPADLVQAAQALSNYMLFLLAARPHMLPPDGSSDAYGELTRNLATCVDYSSGEELRRLLRRYEDFPSNIIRFNKPLRRGCELGKFLVGRRGSPARDTLEMICEVWVEMLCYVGHGCGRESHAKQLSSGGELLTVAALVARYMTSPNLRRLVSASTQSNLQHLQSA